MSTLFSKIVLMSLLLSMSAKAEDCLRYIGKKDGPFSSYYTWAQKENIDVSVLNRALRIKIIMLRDKKLSCDAFDPEAEKAFLQAFRSTGAT